MVVEVEERWKGGKVESWERTMKLGRFGASRGGGEEKVWKCGKELGEGKAREGACEESKLEAEAATHLVR
jgi:hypothetical protein